MTDLLLYLSLFKYKSKLFYNPGLQISAWPPAANPPLANDNFPLEDVCPASIHGAAAVAPSVPVLFCAEPVDPRV
jgi:hypothetical protein